MSAIELNFMGQVITFDMVTLFGLACASVFTIGFAVAMSNDAETLRACNRRR